MIYEIFVNKTPNVFGMIHMKEGLAFAGLRSAFTISLQLTLQPYFELPDENKVSLQVVVAKGNW